MKTLVTTLVLGVFAAATATAQTWTYDPDSNQGPNAAGEPFEGATVGGANSTRSLIDLGGGDIVFQINTIDPNTDTSSFFEQAHTAGPASNQWDVDNTTGYSAIWEMQIDPAFAADQGSADLIAADGSVFPVMRIYKTTASDSIVVRIQSIFGTGITEHRIGNPDAYHTYRMDVQGGTAKVYIDDYAFPILTSSDIVGGAGTFDFLRFGDGTGSGDGKTRTQLLSTFQSGIAPVPTAPDPTDVSHQLFLAHYDGNTGSGGLDADFAAGNAAAIGTGGVISSNAKFGAGSLDGITASGAVTYDTAGNFNVSSGTVEMWVDHTNWGDGNFNGLFAAYISGGEDIRLQKTSGNTLQAYMVANGEVWSLTTGDLSAIFADGEFHHVAWSWDFNANKAALYVDGVVVADAISYSAGLNGVIDYTGTVASAFQVGTIQSGGNPIDGVIDEFRISDQDLYGGQAFTPQNQPYVPEPSTMGLIGAGLLLIVRRRHAA